MPESPFKPTNPITSEDLCLDEIVVILRRMEVTQELIEQDLGVLVWQGMPFWRRWFGSWREARRAIQEQASEGYPLGHNPQEMEGLRFGQPDPD